MKNENIQELQKGQLFLVNRTIVRYSKPFLPQLLKNWVNYSKTGPQGFRIWGLRCSQISRKFKKKSNIDTAHNQSVN